MLGGNTPGRSEIEQAIMSWLQDTRQAHDISWERWAALAQTSATNITRFLKHGRPVPKLSTLYALADALGETRPSFGAPFRIATAVDRVPVLAISCIIAGGMEEAMQQAVEFRDVANAPSNAIAVEVTVDTASHHAILPGDVVILSRDEPKPGDLVAVVEGRDGCGIYLYQPPLLLPAAPGRTTPVPIGERMILGVVRQVQRDLPRR